MSILKKVFIGIGVLLLLAVIALYATGNEHVLNGIGKTYLIGKSKPDIDDMEYFSVSDIKADHPEAWPMHSKYNLGKISQEHSAKVDSMETTALLVFKDDSLLFEQYWNHTDEKTLSNSFSMAKSFTAMLIGKAIQEGYIKSLDEPVSDFLPQFKDGMAASLTIRHLLEMSSGIPFGESYNSPFGYMAKAYYGDDLEKETMRFMVEKTPGTFWTYEGGNTVLLGMILRKATGRTPSEYFFQKIWSCVGAENDAHWNLDHEGGLEKTFSGFYATARDFARIGKLYEHNGVWDSDTLLPQAFVQECITPNNVVDEKGEGCNWYGLHWWLGEHGGDKFFSCRGMRGQYIAVIPDKHIIMVRLGHNQNKERTAHMPPDLFMYLDIAKELADQK
jgi:CubicO group peptidase (beta-lactamase class C family)